MKAALVANDLGLRKSYQKILHLRQYELVVYANAAAALSAFYNEFFPIVIIDASLKSSINALDVCRRMRSLSQGPYFHILVIPESNDPSYLDSFIKAGTDDFISKSYDDKMIDIRIAIAERQSNDKTLYKQSQEKRKKKICYRPEIQDDITEYTLNKESLDEGNKKYRRIIDVLGKEYFFYAHDVRGIFVYVSPSIVDILGYSQNDFCRHFSTFLTDNPMNLEVIKYTELSIQGIKQDPYEVEVVHKDGSMRRLEVTEVPVFDDRGQVVAVEGIAHDITDRIRLQGELKRSKDFLDSIVNSLDDPVFVKDEQHRWVLLNDKACELLGKPRQELIGRTEEVSQLKELVDRIQKKEDQVFRTGKTITYEEEMLRNGKTQTFEIKKTLFIDSGTNNKFIAGTIRDITDHRKIERALRAVVEGTVFVTGDYYFRSLVCHMVLAFDCRYAFITHSINCPATRVRTLAFWNGDSIGENIEYNLANTPCEKVFNGKICYYPDNVQKLFPEDKDLVELNVRSYLGVPLLDFEGKLMGHLVIMDNKPMQVEIKLQSIIRLFAARAGAELERKRAEEALQKSEARFRAIFERAGMGMTMIDTKGHGQLVAVNPALQKMLGYSNKELTNMKFSEFTHPEDIPENMKLYKEAIEGNHDHYEMDERYFTKKNELVWVHLTGSVVRNKSGKTEYIIGMIEDITKRKDSEFKLLQARNTLEKRVEERTKKLSETVEKLKEVKERLDLALRSPGVGTWTWDTSRDKTIWDGGHIHPLFGPMEGSFSGSSADFFRILHPNDRERMKKLIADVLEKDVKFDTEYRVFWPDKSLHYIADRAKLHRNSNKDPVRMTGVCWDITERKEAENSLREINVALSNAMPGISRLDSNGKYVYVNDIYAKMLGYNPEKLLGMMWSVVVHPEDQQRIHSTYNLMKEAGKGECELRGVRKDGSVFNKRVLMVKIMDEAGRFIGHHCFMEDITERKIAENNRTIQLRYERAIADCSQILLSQKGFDEILMECCLKLLNASETSRVYIFENVVNNQNDLCMSQIAEISAPDVKSEIDNPGLLALPYKEFSEKMKKELSTGNPYGGILSEMPKKNRNILQPLEILSFLVLPINVRGDWFGFIGFDDCKSKRKWDDYQVVLLQTAAEMIGAFIQRRSAEEELLKLNVELEKRVKDRTAELEATNKELQSFVYSVSHDLRAPLRAISGFAEVLKRRHRDSVDEKVLHYLDNIVDGATQMDMLIKDLLVYSRIGYAAIQRNGVDLRTLLVEIQNTLAGKHHKKNRVLTIPDDLPPVYGDRTLCKQIFTNLLDNAITYSSRVQKPKVEVSWKKKNGNLIICIRDNGIGISPEYSEKIFHIFQRLHTDDEYPGTGIGLAIVRKAAQLLDGKVWMESKEGKGSKFFVKLKSHETFPKKDR